MRQMCLNRLREALGDQRPHPLALGLPRQLAAAQRPPRARLCAA